MSSKVATLVLPGSISKQSVQGSDGWTVRTGCLDWVIWA